MLLFTAEGGKPPAEELLLLQEEAGVREGGREEGGTLGDMEWTGILAGEVTEELLNTCCCCCRGLEETIKEGDVPLMRPPLPVAPPLPEPRGFRTMGPTGLTPPAVPCCWL